MNLRSSYPRSIREKLGGYVHLGRMIDKCRAKGTDTLGEYIYPCPMDKLLLDFLGITAELFFEAVRSRSDDEMVQWVESTARSHTPQELKEWNFALLTRGPETDEKREYFRTILEKIDPSRTDITSWAGLLDLEEGRAVPLKG